jgi:hypothetical protein
MPGARFDSTTIFAPCRATCLYADAVITGSIGRVSIKSGFLAATVSTSAFCVAGSKLALVRATTRMPSGRNPSRTPAVTAWVKSESSCQTRAAV